MLRGGVVRRRGSGGSLEVALMLQQVVVELNVEPWV